MANPSIGAVDFIRIGGRIAEPGYGLVDISRPGSDGHELWKMGKRAPSSTLRTVRDVSSAANAKAHIEACAALKGTLVTVTYGDGQTATNVAIVDVAPIGSVEKHLNGQGGVTAGSGDRYMIRHLWTVQKVA